MNEKMIWEAPKLEKINIFSTESGDYSASESDVFGPHS